MNKKAENFKKYLDEKDIKAFTVDEIKDDQFQTVVFRSAADINAPHRHSRHQHLRHDPRPGSAEGPAR